VFGEIPLIMVEDPAALDDMLNTLRGATAIAVDTEADSFHHYQEKVCLIQLSDLERDWIVDPLCFRPGQLSALGDVLGNPDVVKVLHGADYDVVSLRRDFGFELPNIFDTMIAAQFIGLPGVGLADLLRSHFGVVVDKKYQRHDWFSRPLFDEHLEYARGDTHWLLALREILSRRLRKIGMLDAHVEECELLARREWSGREDGDAAFLRLKGATALDADGRRALRSLYEYRDGLAKSADRPAFKVMPHDLLLKLAVERPADVAQLDGMMRPGSSLIRRYGSGLVDAVTRARFDERPLPVVERKPRSNGSAGGGANVERLMGHLKNWRNDLVDELGLNPVVIANNQLLKEIARLAPGDVDALAAVPGIRQWQVRQYGSRILDALASAGPAPERKGRRRSGGRRRSRQNQGE
jgi:ribonuclease D